MKFPILSEFRLYITNNWVSRIPSHKFRLFFYKKVFGFKIGSGSSIYMNCSFDAASGLSLGYNSVINAKCRIDTRGGVVIGDNVSVSNEVTVLTADHDMDTEDMQGRNKKVVICDYVWIGTRAMILPGVTIGEGAVVAAGAVVAKDVNPFEVVAGVPAKFIRYRLRKSGYSYNANYKRLFQ